MLLDAVWDIVFPKHCVRCNQEGDYLCSVCLTYVDVVTTPYCPECRRPTRYGELCASCSPLWDFDGVTICTEYNGAVKDLVHTFKYEGCSSAADLIAAFLVAGISRTKSQIGVQGDWIVIPVPMTYEKELERGYNQASLLACLLATELQLIVNEKSLIKTRSTRSQIELTRRERLNNVKDSYGWVAAPLSGLSILLVDDITTTGATLSECAKTLKKAGAGRVWGVVLAKGH
ncbi:MAG: double zinc ribbon domain-containing protein [Patescibacteria group bacterium]